MYKIYVIEDDATIAQAVRAALSSWGHEVRLCADFQDVMREFAALSPHLVLIDIGLPYFNGYHWCRAIRRVSKVPIAFLSSASDNMNIVMAVDSGADDFIAKPFDLSVLVAKAHALLRRAYDFAGTAELFEHEGLIVDVGAATASFGEARAQLTKNELRILTTLWESRGRTVSRDELMQRLWETDQFIDDNTLTVNVTRLRKKLKDIGVDEWILTKKGLGYMVP